MKNHYNLNRTGLGLEDFYIGKSKFYVIIEGGVDRIAFDTNDNELCLDMFNMVKKTGGIIGNGNWLNGKEERVVVFEMSRTGEFEFGIIIKQLVRFNPHIELGTAYNDETWYNKKTGVHHITGHNEIWVNGKEYRDILLGNNRTRLTKKRVNEFIEYIYRDRCLKDINDPLS